MDPATLARVIGIGRIAIGAGLLALPRLTGTAWLGEPGAQPGGQLAVASLGARDLALGAGTVWALGGRRRDPRPWLLASATGDLVDFVGVLRHRQALPSASAIATGAMAAGAAAANLWLADELG
jgi:hypothetical protein